MPETKLSKLSTWLFKRPAIFAVFSTLLMFVSLLIYNLSVHISMAATVQHDILLISLITLAFFICIVGLIRSLPPKNLDRPSFVAIVNGQTIIFVTLAAIAQLLSYTYGLPAALMIAYGIATPLIIIGMLIICLIAAYTAGIQIAGLYAKYRRVRAMGVSMWRIICTAPFGFTMLWIPGYLLPAPASKEPAISLSTGWYARLTKFILKRPANTIITFAILMLMNGLLFGFNMALSMLAITLVFACWVMITGVQNFRKNIGGAYTWAAIGVNVILWVITIFTAIY